MNIYIYACVDYEMRTSDTIMPTCAHEWRTNACLWCTHGTLARTNKTQMCGNGTRTRDQNSLAPRII